MRFIIAVACLIVVFSGCGNTEIAESTPAPASSEQASSPDTEQTNPADIIVVTAGDSFDIILRANPSTGYRWKIISIPDTLLDQTEEPEFVRDQAPDGMVGVGGLETWEFKAIASGMASLEFGKFSPGSYGEGDPAETRTFTVSID